MTAHPPLNKEYLIIVSDITSGKERFITLLTGMKMEGKLKIRYEPIHPKIAILTTISICSI
jgi:hypothetical protein